MDTIIAAKSKGREPTPDPLDVLFEFLIEENGTIGTIYAHHTEKDMNLALAQPWCSIGSDGYALATEGPLRRGHPHPRSFGTFPRVLGEYVRNRQILTLEEAIRKMTSHNADKVGLLDRGCLRRALRRRLCLRSRSASSTGRPTSSRFSIARGSFTSWSTASSCWKTAASRGSAGER